MDKIIRNESIFNEESPFISYDVEKYVSSKTGRSFFFNYWIRNSHDPTGGVIVLTANDGTDDAAQVKVLKNEAGYYLEFSRISKLSL